MQEVYPLKSMAYGVKTHRLAQLCLIFADLVTINKICCAAYPTVPVRQLRVMQTGVLWRRGHGTMYDCVKLQFSSIS